MTTLRPPTDSVLRDIRALSSGTMATLIRELAIPNIKSGSYEVVDRVRSAFVAHVAGVVPGKYEAWQDAWDDFARTPQAIVVAAGGPVHAEGAGIRYELHFWDGRTTTRFANLSDLDSAFRAATAFAPAGDQGQLEAVVYRRRGERQLIARTHGHRLSDGRAEVRPLAGWEEAEMAPLVPAQKTVPTFAELFGCARHGLRRLAESWHQARGATPTEYLTLFSSLTEIEEITVVRALRAVRPADGEPMDWVVSRRAIAVQRALDEIQEARGLPPIMPGPPPGGHPAGYVLTEGDCLEAQRIAGAVTRFFGASTPAVVVRVERDRDGWRWVRVCDVDGNSLRMGTGSFQVGTVQCVGSLEAEVMAAEIRRAIDAELAAALKHEQGVVESPMPRHIARRLGMAGAADAVPAPTVELEEAITCGPRR
jgi:hypothetical protein